MSPLKFGFRAAAGDDDDDEVWLFLRRLAEELTLDGHCLQLHRCQ